MGRWKDFWANLKRKLRASPRVRRLQKLKRSPKVFVPFPRHWLVINLRPISVLLVLVSLGASLYLLYRSDIFLVRQIELQDNSGGEWGIVSEGQLEDSLQSHFARSIFRVSLEEVEKDLRDEFIGLKAVSIEKDLPDKLIVSWSARQAAAQLTGGQEEVNYLVDESGLVFGRAAQLQVSSNALPQLEGWREQELTIGTRLSGEYLQKTLKAVQLLAEFRNEEQFRLQRIILFNQRGHLKLFFAQEGILWLNLEEDVAEQIDQFLLIKHGLEQEGRGYAEIDLRYKFPVIR